MSARNVVSAATGYMAVGALERALSLVIMPITTRLFAPSDFASLIAINNITALLNLVVGVFLIRGLPALLAAQPDESARHDAATTVFRATMALGILSVAMAASLAPWIGATLAQPPGFAGLLQLALVATLATLTGQCCFATARSLEVHGPAIRSQSLALLAQAACVLLLLYAGVGLAAIFWAGLVAGVANAVRLWPLARRWFAGTAGLGHLTRATQISAHLLALNLGSLLILNCSGLILNGVGHAEDAAAFAIAAGAAGIGMLATIAFDSAWTPYLLRRRDDPDFATTARRMFELHSAAFLLAGATGALFAHEVFALLVGPRFVDAYRLVPPLIGAYGLFAFANNFAQGILLDARPHRFAWIGLLTAGLYLACGIPAAWAWGAYGLIAAMAAAFAVMIVLTQRASYAALPISYAWGKHAILWALACIGVGWAAGLPLGWQGTSIKTVVLALLIAGMVASGAELRGEIARLLSLRRTKSAI